MPAQASCWPRQIPSASSPILPFPHPTQVFPINKEKYPTQNDATDDIYPLGPPKPIFHLKKQICLEFVPKSIILSIIPNYFPISPSRWGYCLSSCVRHETASSGRAEQQKWDVLNNKKGTCQATATPSSELGKNTPK